MFWDGLLLETNLAMRLLRVRVVRRARDRGDSRSIFGRFLGLVVLFFF